VSQLVVALTGTDHHPFERLVHWVDSAATRRTDVRFVIQYGMSAAPRVAEGHRFIVHDHLVSLLSAASAVVCHGGPGLITDAREAGHVPLCVPRDPLLGEHVDGHQQRFAALAAREGTVRTVLRQEDFDEALDSTLADAASGVRTFESTERLRAAARALVMEELDGLLQVRPYRLARLHRSGSQA
jgi:UDP-N-acetylglucosamine transferase subunit ALG13